MTLPPIYFDNTLMAQAGWTARDALSRYKVITKTEVFDLEEAIHECYRLVIVGAQLTFNDEPLFRVEHMDMHLSDVQDRDPKGFAKDIAFMMIGLVEMAKRALGLRLPKRMMNEMD